VLLFEAAARDAPPFFCQNENSSTAVCRHANKLATTITLQS
jgi:hypothetical protein